MSTNSNSVQGNSWQPQGNTWAVGSVWMFIGVLGLGVLITILGQVGLSRGTL